MDCLTKFIENLTLKQSNHPEKSEEFNIENNEESRNEKTLKTISYLSNSEQSVQSSNSAHFFDLIFSKITEYLCRKNEIAKVESLFEDETLLIRPKVADLDLKSFQMFCDGRKTKFDSENNCKTLSLFALIKDILIFCDKNQFDNYKIIALLEIFHSTYSFFINSGTIGYKDVIGFFREMVLLHSVQDPPISIEVLSLDDCCKVLEFFEKYFLKNIILLRAVAVDQNIIGIDMNKEIIKPTCSTLLVNNDVESVNLI